MSLGVSKGCQSRVGSLLDDLCKGTLTGTLQQGTARIELEYTKSVPNRVLVFLLYFY